MEDMFEIQRRLEEEKEFYKMKQAHDLTVEMSNEAAKYAKLASLAERDEIDTVKRVLRGRWLYLTYPVEKANKWVRKIKNGEKIDKRKKSDEKSAYDYMTSRISEMFNIDIQIDDFSFFGFDSSAISVYFTIKGDKSSQKYELVIPETEKLNKDNIDYCSYGKLRLSYQRPNSTSCWDYICSSYTTDELKAKFEEFRNSKGE